MEKFLNLTGLTTFLTLLKQKFATIFEVEEVEADIAEVEADTDTYVLNIDYESILAFDTSFIVSGSATSPTINVGQVGFMVIAKS